jgi:hypothetical protein
VGRRVKGRPCPGFSPDQRKPVRRYHAFSLVSIQSADTGDGFPPSASDKGEFPVHARNWRDIPCAELGSATTDAEAQEEHIVRKAGTVRLTSVLSAPHSSCAAT